MNPINGNLEARGAGNTTAVSHIVFSIMNLHFKDSGLINFVLFIDDKEAGHLPLYIRKG